MATTEKLERIALGHDGYGSAREHAADEQFLTQLENEFVHVPAPRKIVVCCANCGREMDAPDIGCLDMSMSPVCLHCCSLAKLN